MKRFVVTYVIGFFVSWTLICGWEYAEDRYYRVFSSRKVAGFCIFHGAISSVIWPIGLPTMYCLTGFAENGWQFPGS